MILYLTFYLQTLSHTRRHAAEQKSENATLNSIGASRNQQICEIGKVQIKRRPRVEVHGVVAHRCNSLNSLFSTKLAIFYTCFTSHTKYDITVYHSIKVFQKRGESRVEETVLLKEM